MSENLIFGLMNIAAEISKLPVIFTWIMQCAGILPHPQGYCPQVQLTLTGSASEGVDPLPRLRFGLVWNC